MIILISKRKNKENIDTKNVTQTQGIRKDRYSSIVPEPLSPKGDEIDKTMFQNLLQTTGTATTATTTSSTSFTTKETAIKYDANKNSNNVWDQIQPSLYQHYELLVKDFFPRAGSKNVETTNKVVEETLINEPDSLSQSTVSSCNSGSDSDDDDDDDRRR